jgi:hypothetical protein
MLITSLYNWIKFLINFNGIAIFVILDFICKLWPLEDDQDEDWNMS